MAGPIDDSLVVAVREVDELSVSVFKLAISVRELEGLLDPAELVPYGITVTADPLAPPPDGSPIAAPEPLLVEALQALPRPRTHRAEPPGPWPRWLLAALLALGVAALLALPSVLALLL